MKILVIQQKMIGDVLATSVTFESLRKKYPSAKLHYLIHSNTIPVIENNKNIDKIIEIKPRIQKGLFGLLAQIKIVRAEKYDIIIDSYSKIQTALICKFSGTSKTISFYKSYSRFFYTNTVIRTNESISIATKAVEHRIQLLEPLGISFEVIKPIIYVKQEEINNVKKRLLENGIDFNKPIVMISALGSNLSKTYPLEYLATIIDEIAKNGNNQILFNYIPNQKSEVEKLYLMCSKKTRDTIFINFYASSLREFISITSQCSALIGNEGGATNIAKALNIPSFTIFSPFIEKNSWNMFENETSNISVHISDYNSTLFSKKNHNYEDVYSLFKPELFKSKLILFLQNNNLK